MKRIICINGRPSAGKDTLGKLFKEKLNNSSIEKMADPIAIALKHTFNFSEEDYAYYREAGKLKDLGIPGCAVNFRTCMIDYGEKFLKSTFHNAIFTDLLWKRFDKNIDNIIITDLGFQIEFDRLVSQVINYNDKNRDDPYYIFLYRLDRPSQIPNISFFEKIKRFILRSKNFPGDSREFVYSNEKNDVILCEKEYNNDNSLTKLEEFVNDEIKHMRL